MSLLLTPIKIGELQLKNRVVMSPMCQYSAKDGYANDWHYIHYLTRAVGQVGLIIQEATAVHPIGRISPDDLGIWEDGQIEPLRKMVSDIKVHGSKIGIQLAHAGRKASTSSIWKGSKVLMSEEGGWQGVAPSAIQFDSEFQMPKELEIREMEDIVGHFKNAAIRAVEVGYDMIEIHAAHGYLIHEFLSPITNKRNDEYGGSFENRIKFLLEIVNGIKKVIPSKISLWVRISAIDYLDDGWQIEDSIQLSKILKTIGVNVMDISSGAIAPTEFIKPSINYQIPFADRIKKEAAIPVAGVGLIVSAAQAEDILKKGQADLICLGRELLRNPYFTMTAAQELDHQNIFPNQYIRSFRDLKR